MQEPNPRHGAQSCSALHARPLAEVNTTMAARVGCSQVKSGRVLSPRIYAFQGLRQV